jgi:hypothetical protein
MNEAIVWSTVFLGRPLVQDVVSGTDNTTLAIIAVASIAVMGVIIYFSLKIDWGKHRQVVPVGRQGRRRIRRRGDKGQRQP